MATQAAKLTGMVTIAVFAAFWPRVGRVLHSTAEFKQLCRPTKLDVSCYGWQKRHDRGKKVATDGTVGGKNGTGVSGSSHMHAATSAVAMR